MSINQFPTNDPFASRDNNYFGGDHGAHIARRRAEETARMVSETISRNQVELRDQLAIEAMKAYLQGSGLVPTGDMMAVAKRLYAMADAMMEVRKVKP